MLALFIAVSFALALVLWAEVRTQSAPQAQARPGANAPPQQDSAQPDSAEATAVSPASAKPAQIEDTDAAILARLSRMLADPEAPPPAAAPRTTEALPRVAGFRPGDVLELEIEGPLPRPEDLRFEQVGRDARLVLEGLPALIFEGIPARHLRPSHIRFRSPQAA